MEKLIVVKIGGNVIDDEYALQGFLKNFASIAGKKILVHGGGKIATAMGEKLGIKSKYIDGRRITDDATIDLVTMVYGGLINKKIVASLQSLGCNATGVSGADANLIPAVKRPVVSNDYGWVGDIDENKIMGENWKIFIDNNISPVVAPLTHDEKGHMLNTNADTIAACIAASLSKYFKTHLVYCFEKNGILTDMDDRNSIVPLLSFDHYLRLKEEGKIFEGILPKLENAFFAVNNGVANVVIGNAGTLALLVNGTAGTRISV